jgi:general secretion pathway protein A
MYKEYFGLRELPFSISPDPRYLYLSDKHREALAHLIYGLQSDGGFVLLTGEVGTGKTTISRCFLGQVPENATIAFILNPKVTAEELLATICDELGIRYPEGNRSVKYFIDLINAYLLDSFAKGKKTVLIIEEAQNLDPQVLEQIRLLTNLETDQQKLLQIIMIGQPELLEILARPDMLQLSQRITARYHLGPLSGDEVGAYVEHRLRVAGAGSSIFEQAAIRKLSFFSCGIPRLINVISDRALLGAYAQGKTIVDKNIVAKAAEEVFGKSRNRVWPGRPLQWALAGLLVISLGVLAAASYSLFHQPAVSSTDTGQKMLQTTEKRKSSLPGLPSAVSPAMSKETAFQRLFKLWNIPGPEKPENNPCSYVRRYRVHCMQNPLMFSDLISLNRPVILKLVNDKDEDYYAVLTALEGQTATLMVHDQTTVADLSEVRKQWTGEYLLFYRIPAECRSTVYPGYRGECVDWLARQLAVIQGRKYEELKNPAYNTTLVGYVKQYQHSVGIKPDGIIGSQSMIHLQNITGSNDPVLRKLKEGAEENVIHP